MVLLAHPVQFAIACGMFGGFIGLLIAIFIFAEIGVPERVSWWLRGKFKWIREDEKASNERGNKLDQEAARIIREEGLDLESARKKAEKDYVANMKAASAP